ncbi:MAG TPA: hypothetical protein DCM40_08575 [Maribacter sp.]|jgi:hypothetical protein|nr:hypothetical protein [Maribacter sp.]|tara:strand:+ start:290 stop:556 length:267 start_codon:yes stop_codon:yes gene_type:complete
MAKEDTKKTEAPETATAQPTAPAPDPMALSIGDLKNLSTVLDVASTRGAFRAGEMANVGFLYNKLQTFLAKLDAQAKPVEAPTAEAKK